LIDELLEEEVQELNIIEQEFKKGTENPKKRKTKLADRSLYGKFHDFKQVDMRDIMQVFEEYKEAETSIKTRLN